MNNIGTYLLRTFVIAYAAAVFFVIVFDFKKSYDNMGDISAEACIIDISCIEEAYCVIYNYSDTSCDVANDTVPVEIHCLQSLFDSKNYSEQNRKVIVKGMFIPLYELNLSMENKDKVQLVYSFMNGEVRIIENGELVRQLQMNDSELIGNLIESIF